MIRNQANLISDELYLFNLPELKSVAEAIQEALDIYARDVMGIAQKIEVTQSWSLINEPGVGMHAHSHSNSIVSGSLYFCEMPKPISHLIFDRSQMYQAIDIRPGSEKRNLYNTQVNIVEPRVGEVLLFPSGINHMVETNQSNEMRHAIAFNSFVRGKIGHFRDVSELRV